MKGTAVAVAFPNAALAKVGTDGEVCIYTLTETDIVVDVTAYVPDGGSVEPIVPGRLLGLDHPLAQQVNGTVKKIDEAQGKLTIDHGPIKNLDMDAMSMVFRAGEPAMLKGLKAGDRIKFDADRVNGQITVTKLQKTK